MIGQLTERAARFLERQQWLNKPGYKFEHGLAFAFGLAGARARPLQNLLQGVWLGHPLHPVLTDLPLGAWTALSSSMGSTSSRRDHKGSVRQHRWPSGWVSSVLPGRP